jgi:membrane protease YdiL (CAAX protease family)
MSLVALLIVLSWRFCDEPSRGRGTALVAAVLAWVLLRDSNAYAVACFAVAFVIAAIASRPRRVAFFAVVVAFLAVSAIGSVSSNIGRRWEGPLKDVITIRMLKDPDRADYLIERGFPMSQAEISRVAGHCVVPSNSRSCVLVTDPRFYAWIRVDGRSVYEHWLRSHPATALSDPVRNSGQLFGHRLRVDRFSHYRFAFASLAEDVFFVRNQRVLLAEALVALGFVITAVRRRPSPLAWIVLTALATTYPHMFVIWSFGALETQRHALAASLIMRLALILAVACVASDTRWFGRHGENRRPVPTRGTGTLSRQSSLLMIPKPRP